MEKHLLYESESVYFSHDFGIQIVSHAVSWRYYHKMQVCKHRLKATSIEYVIHLASCFSSCFSNQIHSIYAALVIMWQRQNKRLNIHCTSWAWMRTTKKNTTFSYTVNAGGPGLLFSSSSKPCCPYSHLVIIIAWVFPLADRRQLTPLLSVLFHLLAVIVCTLSWHFIKIMQEKSIAI